LNHTRSGETESFGFLFAFFDFILTHIHTVVRTIRHGTATRNTQPNGHYSTAGRRTTHNTPARTRSDRISHAHNAPPVIGQSIQVVTHTHTHIHTLSSVREMSDNSLTPETHTSAARLFGFVLFHNFWRNQRTATRRGKNVSVAVAVKAIDSTHDGLCRSVYYNAPTELNE